MRFLSCEPLLGHVELSVDALGRHYGGDPREDEPGIDWVIVGGESGRDARPMHPGWARALRDQCVDASVPFFFKQWGEWAGHSEGERWMGTAPDGYVSADNSEAAGKETAGAPLGVWRVGKRAAGRMLDGRTWDEYPERRQPKGPLPWFG